MQGDGGPSTTLPATQAPRVSTNAYPRPLLHQEPKMRSGMPNRIYRGSHPPTLLDHFPMSHRRSF